MPPPAPHGQSRVTDIRGVREGPRQVLRVRARHVPGHLRQDS